ncbi:MAG: hypothetical protein AAFQ08_03545, partial [Bacteroidota bacterium]
EHLYLKFFVANDSSLSYSIASAQFSLTQAKRERVALPPRYAEAPEQICAYGAETLCYVLPRYGLHPASVLTLTVSEGQGERTLRLEVPGEVLLQAPCYKIDPDASS